MSPTRRTTLTTLGALTLSGLGAAPAAFARSSPMTDAPDLILHGGRFTTLDRANPDADAAM